MKICSIAAASLSFSLLASVHADDLQSAKVRHADLHLNLDVCQDWDPHDWVFSDLKPEVVQYQSCLEKAIARVTATMSQPAFTS